MMYTELPRSRESVICMREEYNRSKLDSYSPEDVLEFIKRRFPMDCKWVDGNCYFFAVILNERFPNGEIVYDVIDGHFLLKLGDKYFDHRGVSTPIKPISWRDFDSYDCLQKQSIVKYCIL